MDQPIKPIETAYKGYRFRSRLEARWAVFFDSVGVPYEYEKEGFDLGGGIYYLPDFWLPKFGPNGGWFEIKGQPATAAERAKALLLARRGKPRIVALLQGSPWPGAYITEVYDLLPLPEAVSWYVDQAIERHDWWLLHMLMQANPLCDWEPATMRAYAADADAQKLLPAPETVLAVRPPHTFHYCAQCNNFGLGELDAVCEVCHLPVSQDHPRILTAYAAARSARFEFGEHGGRP